MKAKLTIVVLLALFNIDAYSQIAITSVSTTSSPAPSSFTYTNGGTTYNWGLAPNNNRALLDRFVAGGDSYTYASMLVGTVKLRRVNNAKITGNFTLVWSESVSTASVHNLFSEYQNDMEPFFNNRVYNRGTDNVFDNTSTNCNNIERLDWIYSTGYATAYPDKVGFAVFERGDMGAHDAFCIAAITSLDGLGNPATYSNIVRVTATNYGDPGPNVTYRILKAQNPSNLLDAANGTQNRGGVLISLQNLGIAASQTIYGYSLFANDLPVSATPANLVDYTNSTYFPTNTGASGGLDILAITGISEELSIAPTHFISFTAVENQNKVLLNWKVENETSVDRYEVERSTDGLHFSTIGQQNNTGNSTGSNTYTYSDIAITASSPVLYYRIKQIDRDGSSLYSKTLSIRRNHISSGIVLYPNPVYDNLNINVQSDNTASVHVTIWNISQRKVISQFSNLSNGMNSISINGLEKLPSGIYQLHITWPDGKLITRPFLKQ